MPCSRIFKLPDEAVGRLPDFHISVQAVPHHDYHGLIMRLATRLAEAGLASQFYFLGCARTAEEIQGITMTSAHRQAKQGFLSLPYEPSSTRGNWISFMFSGSHPKGDEVPEAYTTMCQYIHDEGYEAYWEKRIGRLEFKPKHGS